MKSELFCPSQITSHLGSEANFKVYRYAQIHLGRFWTFWFFVLEVNEAR